MSDYKNIISKLLYKKNLAKDDIQFIADASISGELKIGKQAAILSLLQSKKVSAKELAMFVSVISKQMPETIKLKEAVDICGTGGSGLSRINTSTISAFILSSLDIKIAKHGNKAASGRFGSFDLLESLGINISPSLEVLSYAYWKEKLAFLFARSFHPVMKHFAGVRMELEFPTIFNILGPLISPVDAKYQIIGTAFEDKMDLIINTAKILKKKNVLVVMGEDGLDEVTLTGKTKVYELKDGKIKKYFISPIDFGVKKSKFDEISGGDENFNTKITKDILSGKCKTRHSDLVFINSAVVLKMMGKVKTLKDGYKMAKSVVDSGLALKKLESYINISNDKHVLTEIIGNKFQEISSKKKI